MQSDPEKARRRALFRKPESKSSRSQQIDRKKLATIYELGTRGLGEVIKFQEAAVRSKLNIVIAGDPDAGSGMLAELTEFIPKIERKRWKLVDNPSGSQVIKLFNWFETGGKGAIVSLPADDPDGALNKLRELYQQESPGTSGHAMRILMVSHIDLVIITFRGGIARAKLICELTGIEGVGTKEETIPFNDIYRYDFNEWRWKKNPNPPGLLRKIRPGK